MTRQVLRASLLSLVLVSWRPVEAWQAERLVENEVAQVVVNYRDLKDRIVKADAVLRGRVIGPGRVLVPSPLPRDRSPSLSTEYQIEVLEIYRSHPNASFIGAIVPVVQTGGEAIVGDTRVRTSASPHLLAKGGEMLLFLRFDERRQWFRISRDDTFSIQGGRIVSDPKWEFSYQQELDGVPTSDAQGVLWRAATAATSEPATTANRDELPPPPPPPPPPPLP